MSDIKRDEDSTCSHQEPEIFILRKTHGTFANKLHLQRISYGKHNSVEKSEDLVFAIEGTRCDCYISLCWKV